MKKSLKLFTMLFILMFVVVVKVNAAEVTVTDETTLKSCIDTAGSTCKLGTDIVLTESLNIAKEVTIDLNGSSIVPSSTFKAGDDSLIIVLHGGTLTIDDSKGNGKISTASNSKVFVGIKMTKAGGDDTKEATLIIEAGTIEGYSFAISGNGNSGRGNTVININGGTLIGLNSTGIYHPQLGELTVSGGTIKGTTGIEMRSGNLYVSGGTIIGTATDATVTPNGNGPTVTGAGIALAQHTTLQEAFVEISGGKIQGATALYETTPQNPNNKEIVGIDIYGGDFVSTTGGSAIYSENKTGFISGGTYSSEFENKYLVNDIKVEKIDGAYVAKNNWSILIDEQIKNGTVTAVEKAYAGDIVKLDIKPDEGYKVSSVEVLDHLDKSIEVKDNSFTMPESPVFVKVTFEKEEVVPNTGDNIITFVVIGLISIIIAGFAINKLRKNA